ncbi:hypothetical protein HBA54_09870 [Pelagibius litoralis]|uniref:Uncharacterized protein n=1 Tax=Pelagibius litoralis TaxID=374515 RepID=A0A967EW05_9PROT|nr:hypothetical protein [Pelagibius litoralis]NIA68899.1 hypothetical protein [Pelagibius litoralis]
MQDVRLWLCRMMVPVLAVIWALAPDAGADEPLPPPTDREICSPNGLYCAVMDAAANETTVFHQGLPLWRRPGWFRDAFLADDGEHMIVGYRGLELLQWDYRPETVMISFWRRDRLIRAVPLSEVIEDTAKLELTTSHFLWGRTVGIDDSSRFVVETVEDRRLTFDITSGAMVGVQAHPFRR